jgi:hypothetical protein
MIPLKPLLIKLTIIVKKIFKYNINIVRKTKISKTFCKMLIIVCIVAILYSLVRSFLFSREGLDNPSLTDFVTGAGNATDRLDLESI